MVNWGMEFAKSLHDLGYDGEWGFNRESGRFEIVLEIV